MKISRRQYLGAAGSFAAGAVLPGLSACHRAEASSLRPDLAGGWVGAQVERAHAWRDGHLPGAASSASLAEDPLRVHTLIIGAGVAGLSTARSLIKAGLDDIAVLDLEDQPGGNARGHLLQGLPCPLGAHYLPMPGEQARDVAQWLEEIGLIRQVNGRWVGDERHLCHSPQERLFVPASGSANGSAPASASTPASSSASISEASTWWQGQWQDGLLPQQHLGAQDNAQYRRFAADVEQARKQLGFAIPTTQSPWNKGLDALDKLTFDQWLNDRGYTSAPLRWLLDYACRDDFGAGTGHVSAWAGLHYFASRHGFELPGQANEEHDAVLTWPEGNGWLTQRLAQGLGARWQAGHVALGIDVGRHEVTVQSWSVKQQRAQTWRASQVVLAVPLFVAQRLFKQAVPALQAVTPQLAYAPWLVSNVLLSKPFFDRPGAPLSWDNVPYSSEGVPGLRMPSLGYVDARHQSLAQVTGPMLLTHYWALGGQSAEQGLAQRQALLKGDWREWAGKVAFDMARIHPDLPGLVTHMDLMRYGHAMVIPVPGLRGHPALAALQKPSGRVHFAHSDLSAYSVFEEAFTHGTRAAAQVLSATGMPRRMA